MEHRGYRLTVRPRAEAEEWAPEPGDAVVQADDHASDAEDAAGAPTGILRWFRRDLRFDPMVLLYSAGSENGERGQIGDRPFPWGDETVTMCFRAEATGPLHLFVNDAVAYFGWNPWRHYRDNPGAAVITVSPEKHLAKNGGCADKAPLASADGRGVGTDRP